MSVDYKYVELPVPWLRTWLGRYDRGVVDMIEGKAKKMIEDFYTRFHGNPVSFDKAQREDGLDTSNGWPRICNSRAEVFSGAEKTGEYSVEFTWWNPRDGESWMLSMSLKMPGQAVSITLHTSDNQTTPHFRLGYDGAFPDTVKSIHEWLLAFPGEEGNMKEDTSASVPFNT